MNPAGIRRALVLAVALAGCATIPHPTAADADRASIRWPATTATQLESDRTRYVAKCSGCHALKPPAKYPEAQWVRYLDKMGDRAKLTPNDYEVILRYLVTLSTRPATP